MRNKYLTLIGAGLMAMATSCTDGYESEPVDWVTLDFVFSRSDSAGTNAKAFLSTIYAGLQNGHNRVNSDYLDAATDDALSLETSDPDVYRLAVGRYDARTLITSDMRWGEYYKGIRRANIFINNIDVVPYNSTYTDSRGQIRPLNVTQKAEARFLRVCFYFELVKRYGGVPLMGDNVPQLGDNMELPRNTFEQCINYIVSELDAIKDDLRTYANGVPTDYNDYAHAPTREACIAMKARVLLYAASPLFNENPIERGNELVGYASYDPERWNLAAQAAKEFIDTYGPEGSGAYGLTQNTMTTGDNPGVDEYGFLRLFCSFYNRSSNPEVIFYRSGSNDHSIETNNGPLGFSNNALGNGRTLPTQNLVDAFPMLDGKPVGESKYVLGTGENQYQNRDPRLNFTVLHHGSQWLNTTLNTALEGTNNPTNTGEYSTTSYYMRKFMGTKLETTDVATGYSNTYHNWVMYRYAEVLLNYAEAQNEYAAAPDRSVYDAIIALRARAGIEAGDDNLYGLDPNMSKEEMRDIIRNERRIEMAFEEQRYWDIRRWRIAETVMNEPLRGLEIRSSGGTLTFEEIDVLEPTFATRQYLYPISYDEVVKNDNMIQNPNW